jgi:hypothetical protein
MKEEKKDLTKQANKVLNVVLPNEYPFIESVVVNDCTYTKRNKLADNKYYLFEEKLNLDVKINIPITMLPQDVIERGKINVYEFEEAFGKNIDIKIDGTILKALNLLGIYITSFDRTGETDFDFI